MFNNHSNYDSTVSIFGTSVGQK